MKNIKPAPLIRISAVLLLVFLLGGCLAARQQKSPLRGGSITIGYNSEPATLNPFSPEGTSSTTRLITSNILWGLLASTADYKYTPRIAEKVPAVENGLVLTLSESLQFYS